MGKLEVISGPMFSGKSEELLRRIKRAKIAKQSISVFKPGKDDRYSKTCVVTHSGMKIECCVIWDSRELLDLTRHSEVIAIDEAQFLDKATPSVIEILVNLGKRVIVAGLDMDSNGIPFNPMPELLARAESVTKVVAVCEICGGDATHTYCHSKENNNPESRVQFGEDITIGPSVLVGEKDHYEARCRLHWSLKEKAYDTNKNIESACNKN